MRKNNQYLLQENMMHVFKMYILIITDRIFFLSFVDCCMFIPKHEISFFHS